MVSPELMPGIDAQNDRIRPGRLAVGVGGLEAAVARPRQCELRVGDRAAGLGDPAAAYTRPGNERNRPDGRGADGDPSIGSSQVEDLRARG